MEELKFINRKIYSLTEYEKQLYKKAHKKWGTSSQIKMMIEESSELLHELLKTIDKNQNTIGFNESKKLMLRLTNLIKEINKFWREKSDVVSIMEELADVDIMVGQLKLILGEDVVNNIKKEKLIRLENLIISSEI
jgi:NTP pyrophosphatase (non-canonical NTP hydrolase)